MVMLVLCRPSLESTIIQSPRLMLQCNNGQPFQGHFKSILLKKKTGNFKTGIAGLLLSAERVTKM